MEEEEKVEAEVVDDGGNHGGEKHHRAASYQLRHRGSHVPIFEGYQLNKNQWCCEILVVIQWCEHDWHQLPVPWCENFPKHRVWHGTDAESVRRRRHHKGDEQNCLKTSLARQLSDGGQDAADAEERAGHDGGEGDKLGNSIHPAANER